MAGYILPDPKIVSEFMKPLRVEAGILRNLIGYSGKKVSHTVVIIPFYSSSDIYFFLTVTPPPSLSLFI